MQDPAGVILSMARFRIWKPHEIIFNTALFIWQFIFLLWTYRFDKDRRILMRFMAVYLLVVGLLCNSLLIMAILYLLMGIGCALLRGRVPLRLILWSALVTHVRLCLERIPGTNRWRYISQTAPRAEMDEWSDDQLLGRHYLYMAPAFNPGSIFIEAMIQYAKEHAAARGKRGYDYLQIGSFILNAILFWWIPGLHGKEVIKFMNIPGFREVCSTLVAAILRWSAAVESDLFRQHVYAGMIVGFYEDGSPRFGKPFTIPSDKQCVEFIVRHDLGELASPNFFKGYVTAMVAPCLYPIEAYLKGTWYLPDRWEKRLYGKMKDARVA
jgi:hypothetical protein